MSRASALDAWDNLKSCYWKIEKDHYEEEHHEDEGDIDGASDIETAQLEEHLYKDMRVLDEFLYAEVTFIITLHTY